MLEDYFEQYLTNVLHLSTRSVEHYVSAIRVLGKIPNYRSSTTNLYDLESLEAANTAIGALEMNPAFIEKNTKGNNMYSAALNHFKKFINFSGIHTEDIDISCMDIALPRPKQYIERNDLKWARSQFLKEQVINAANHQCEIDISHYTFISKVTAAPFMEAHHLIPMQLQPKFNSSLDIYANIICICPNCHRMLHYGADSIRRIILEQQYDRRKDRFLKSGFDISLEHFLEYTCF